MEYVVSAKLFETLPEEEKKLWHSHFFEVYTSVYRINILEKSHVIGAIVPLLKDFDGHG